MIKLNDCIFHGINERDNTNNKCKAIKTICYDVEDTHSDKTENRKIIHCMSRRMKIVKPWMK